MTLTISEAFKAAVAKQGERATTGASNVDVPRPPAPQIYVQGSPSIYEMMVFLLANGACIAYATLLNRHAPPVVMTFVTDVDYTVSGTRYVGWGYSLIDKDQGPMAFYFGRDPVDTDGRHIIMAADLPQPYNAGDAPPWDPAQDSVSAYRIPL